MWLACVARAGRAVDARDDALAGLQVAALGLHDDRLVVAHADDVDDARGAVAVLALDRPDVGDLAAAGRVERRLGELHEPAVDRGDGRVLLERLVAGEVRLGAGCAREVAGALAQVAGLDARPRAEARLVALALHERAEPGRVDRQPLLGGELGRDLDREAERVVELEGVERRDLAVGPRALDDVVEELRALLERAPEALLLGADPEQDRLALAVQLRICRAHDLDDLLDEPRQEARGDADPPALLDRPAHDAAQDVAAILVGGHDAVGDEERHRARVVGEDPQRALVGL